MSEFAFCYWQVDKSAAGNGEDDRKKKSEAVKTSIYEFETVKEAIKVKGIRFALFENLCMPNFGMRQKG